MDSNKDMMIRGTRVDRVTMDEAIARFKSLMEKDGLSLIITPNSEILGNAEKNSDLAKALSSAELVIPDGIGLVLASKIKNDPLPERVAGIDFCLNALRECAKMGVSAYFLGAKPGIAKAAADNIMKAVPGLIIAGTRDGYFKPEEEPSVVDEINASGAGFLCLAMGSPKQELFALKYKDILKPRAAIGVGGSFDVWSGALKRAPEFYQKHGLEWLYRLAQEPSRFKRVAGIPVFLLKVIASDRK